jgi:hypothetical protein
MKKISLIKNPASPKIDSMFCPRFRAFISSVEWFGTEFREFSVPRNGLERNSKSLLLILFHGTEFRAFFSSAERFGTEFREFSVPRNSWNSAGTNQLFHLFRLPLNNFFVGNCQPYLVPEWKRIPMLKPIQDEPVRYWNAKVSEWVIGRLNFDAQLCRTLNKISIASALCLPTSKANGN